MIHPATLPAAGSDADRIRAAARALEAMLLRQIVSSSGAFRGSDGAGSGVRADLFADALADAVARTGGIGLAASVARSLGVQPEAPGPTAASLGEVPPAPVPGAGSVAPRSPSPRAPGSLEALPLEGRVTSRFGVRTDPFTGLPRDHDGIDVAAPEGSPIRAASAGVVVRAGPRGGYGNTVELDHGDGTSTLYGHARELLVAPGESVAAGQEIATVGSTGRSTGPHLHLEVRQHGQPVDPARVLKIYARRADGSHGSGP